MQLYSVNKEMGFRAFDDCIAAQRMTTNESINAGRKPPEPDTERTKEARPVTTTVAGRTPTSQSEDRKSPFTDILGRSSQKKEE
jgi:hypothetical protein